PSRWCGAGSTVRGAGQADAVFYGLSAKDQAPDPGPDLDADRLNVWADAGTVEGLNRCVAVPAEQPEPLGRQAHDDAFANAEIAEVAAGVGRRLQRERLVQDHARRQALALQLGYFCRD